MSDTFASSPSPELLQMRRKARQRFVGVAVLFVTALIALPFVLQTAPVQVAPDMAIDIKNPAITSQTPSATTSSAASADARSSASVSASAPSSSSLVSPSSSAQPANKAATPPAPSSSAPSPAPAVPAALAPQQTAPAPATTSTTASPTESTASKTLKSTAPSEPAPTPSSKKESNAHSVTAQPAAPSNPTPTPLTPPAAKPKKTEKTDKAETPVAPAKTTENANGRHDNGARAAALLNGNSFIVQAGSYADKELLTAAQSKIQKAGFQSYTQSVTAHDGKPRMRLRLGPYETQAEANNVAAKIEKLGIKTIVLNKP